MVIAYVVLHHTGHGPDHFDLMYESEPDGPLTTFRCPRWPPAVGDVWTELPPHRRAYLTYEGPVSGDRGEVRRVASGACEPSVGSVEPPRLLLRLIPSQNDELHVAIHHRIDLGAADDVWTVTNAGGAGP